ncbi:MAG: histone deacetylase family protein [Beijerinckiaceae bacterium]
MHLFFNTDQLLHKPQKFMRAGQVVDPFENPDRVTVLSERLIAAGLTLVDPGDHGMAAIRVVHDTRYLTFLETAYAEWQKFPDAGPEVWPNIHPYRGTGADLERAEAPVGSIIGQAGWYIGDMAVAMGEGSWKAAYASAQTAIAAANAVLTGHDAAFGLCRPPGHHAYRDRACGFCFLNNAAIAAERLRTRFDNVAIIDFDTHHGDGTQAIFYDRADVLVASTHTDPTAYYPYYSGYAGETGRGAGKGANLNIPLPVGANDDAYIKACIELADAAMRFGAKAVVLSAGWDAHKDDPLSKLAVTSEAFSRIGEIFGKLPVPVVILQEGGYSLTAAGEAAPRFAKAFASVRGTTS